MNPRYESVAARAGHRCEYCRAPESVFNFPFEVEHVLPVSLGGTDEEANLALACRSCNVRKAANVQSVDPQTSERADLFNPRADRWDGHFRSDVETAEVIGTTPSGRATVSLLAMNNAVQSAARRQWKRLGLFP